MLENLPAKYLHKVNRKLILYLMRRKWDMAEPNDDRRKKRSQLIRYVFIGIDVGIISGVIVNVLPHFR